MPQRRPLGRQRDHHRNGAGPGRQRHGQRIERGVRKMSRRPRLLFLARLGAVRFIQHHPGLARHNQAAADAQRAEADTKEIQHIAASP